MAVSNYAFQILLWVMKEVTKSYTSTTTKTSVNVCDVLQGAHINNQSTP